MTVYKYALADPKYLLEVSAFYWESAVDTSLSPAIYSNLNVAREKGLPQIPLAEAVVSLVSHDPPRFNSYSSVRKYFADKVLSNLPKRYWFDDVFWSCFLALANDTKVPECELGGPLHKMVIKVYDDFDPRDVNFG